MSIDIAALHITNHAADQYTVRVTHDRLSRDPLTRREQRSRAKGRIAARMRNATALPDPGMHDGTMQKAWDFGDCVATEKCGCITTILTRAMYAHGLRSDT